MNDDWRDEAPGSGSQPKENKSTKPCIGGVGSCEVEIAVIKPDAM